MPRHTLFAYVDGSDLDDIAEALEARLRAFVEARDWVADEAWVVNQQLEADASCTEPEDISCWDLGLNLHLPDPSMPAGDGMVRRCGGDCALLRQLARRVRPGFRRRDSDAQTGIAEDLYWIADGSPHVKMLARVIGLRPVR